MPEIQQQKPAKKNRTGKGRRPGAPPATPFLDGTVSMSTMQTALPSEELQTASNPPLDLHELLRVLQAVRRGDFSVRLPGDWTGLDGKIADTFNDIVAANERMAEELERVGQVVGKEGKTRQRVAVRPATGRLGARWRRRSTR